MKLYFSQINRIVGKTLIKIKINFALGIFIGIFITSFLIPSLLIWISYNLVSKITIKNYISRYKFFSQVLETSLIQLEGNTEKIMFNTAKVIAYEDEKKGLLSKEIL